MFEGKRVVAGEASLSGLTTDRNVENGQATSASEMLEALVSQHSRLVYRIAYAVLRSHHDAEDATQETFLRVLRYSAKLAAVENPKTWLARVAWRVAVDRNGKRRAAQEVLYDDPEDVEVEIASTDTAADDEIHSSQLGAALANLIAALPRKLREPLVLSTIEEMTPREIAATLKISEAAVRSRIFRARQVLKEKLAQTASAKQVTP